MKEQRRALGALDATVLVVSNMLGVGIFLTPAAVADLVRTPGWYFAVWAVGGGIALAGALGYAELGAALPEAGGEYVYLREAYGPLFGFLHAWASALVTLSGAIAAIAVGLATSGLRAAGGGAGDAPSPAAVRGVALAALLALTLLNILGVKATSRLQNAVAAVAVGGVAALLVLGFAGGRGSAAHFLPSPAGGPPGWAALGAALVPIFFTYAGWNAPTYVAGEIARPWRTLPRALALGTALTTALYLGLNALYVYAFPLDRLRGVASVGEAAAGALVGPWAAGPFAAIIALIILGTLNATILTAARIPYALGRDGALLTALGALHLRFGTPARALAVQAAWVGVLILTGTFESLLTFSTVMMVAISALTVGAVFVLRARAPGLARPYRAWGYPAVPAMYLAACLGMGVSAFAHHPVASCAALGIVAAGIPVYRWRAGRAGTWRPMPGHG